MAKRPYFTITPDSFEKNAGYKSTVHALAELIDNSFEAEASEVAIVLQIDTNSNLQKIAVIDNGLGMDPELLQMADPAKRPAHTWKDSEAAAPLPEKNLENMESACPRLPYLNVFS